MVVTYRREMNHNYMIIESLQNEPEGYVSKMLAGNKIEGLLKFRLHQGEEKQEFYYEITSRQPICRVLEQKQITGNEIRRLLLDIAAILHKIEEYLLQEEQILLDPEYLYVDPDQFSVSLCMIPGYICDFPSAFSKFLEYLLGKVNHQDKDSVALAYNLYHESLKENYGMADLLSCLQDGNDGIFTEHRQEDSHTLSRKGNDSETWRSVNREDQESRNPDWGKQEGESKNWKNDEWDYQERGDKRIAVQSCEGISGEISRNYPKERTYGKTSEKKRTERSEKKQLKEVLKIILKGLILIMAGGILLWFLTGEAGFHQYGLWGVAASVLLTAFRVVFLIKGEHVRTGKIYKEKLPKEQLHKEKRREELSRSGISYNEKLHGQEKRQHALEIKEVTENGANGFVFEGEEQEVRGQGNEQGEQDIQTTLLADLDKLSIDLAVLESLGKDRKSIKISYVPFVIGKHEEMTDYCLSLPTVSRLHMRVDRKEGVYIITDLNSTNGTSVNGYLLQANETVSVNSGDTVYLANVGYRFWEGVN